MQFIKRNMRNILPFVGIVVVIVALAIISGGRIFIKGNLNNILWLGVISLATCVLNFGVGRWLGRRYGDVVAGGQLLGQKNTALGIWMANTFLNPLTSVTLAFYAIWQNLFNSWQIWRHDRTMKRSEEI